MSISNWRKAKLGDIADMCLGKMLDKEKNKGEYQPYLANVNVRWGDFDFDNLSQMRFEEKEKERYGLKYGDLIICEGGEPGRCAIWREQVPEMKIQKALHRVRVRSDYSYEFIYYRLVQSARNNELEKHFIGSTIKHLTGIGLKEVEFEYPDLPTQQKIAKVLATLDAKIALNNRINAELEAMAKLLYDYWFVQFDFPMTAAQAAALGQAQLEGQPYKSSGGKMVFNPILKREIPEGWEVKRISEVAVTKSGGTPLKSETEYYEGGNVTWINSGEVNRPVIIKGENFITEEGLKNSSAKMIPTRSILMAMYGATAGRVSLLLTEACLNQAISAIIPNQACYLNFIRHVLTDLYKHLVIMSSGSARDNLSQDLIRNVAFAEPPSELLETFEKLAAGKMLLIENNLKQNQELTTLRDWLLPMLMNGQVTVG